MTVPRKSQTQQRTLRRYRASAGLKRRHQHLASGLLLFPIFFRNVVLRQLLSPHFPFILIVGFLDTRNCTCLKRISFLDQLIHTLGVCLFRSGQPLQISPLSAGRLRGIDLIPTLDLLQDFSFGGRRVFYPGYSSCPGRGLPSERLLLCGLLSSRDFDYSFALPLFVRRFRGWARAFRPLSLALLCFLLGRHGGQFITSPRLRSPRFSSLYAMPGDAPTCLASGLSLRAPTDPATTFTTVLSWSTLRLISLHQCQNHVRDALISNRGV